MAELFEQLESNDKEAAEKAKQKLNEQFQSVRDPWLLNGLYEYYLNTNSVRSMEILVNVIDPHHNHLFERLSDSIKSPKTDIKVQALTLLGHVVRRQPMWLYRLSDHTLLKDILKLLKNEEDILPLISALLVIIVLIPMIPSAIGVFLHDIFEIFSRLASWDCTTRKLGDDQMVHMQMALYALFLRLYGMYPCNFIAYLRSQYKDKNKPVFVHTIKPMLDNVKMHPSLVTASKDIETTTERWKAMSVHEVIVECERFSLDVSDRCPHDNCQLPTGFRSRSGTTNSTTLEKPYQLQALKSSVPSLSTFESKDFFSPSMVFQTHTPPISETTPPTNIPHAHLQVIQSQNSNYQSQEGTSPPEAAIEATPETTPIRDLRLNPGRQPPLNSQVARALTSFTRTGSSNTTPTHSQPSSPMRKESSPFNFPSSDHRNVGSTFIPRHHDSFAKQRIQFQERTHSIDLSGDVSYKSRIPPPTSPLKIVQTDIIRPVPIRTSTESPVSQEDEEVHSIVGAGETSKQLPRQTCDSVLHENDGAANENIYEDQDHGSPCTVGGLHMPNINDFAKTVQRLRYHSQCNNEPEHSHSSTGSSPGNNIPFPDSTTVRRAISCPEMKKSPVVPIKDNTNKPLDETDEETMNDNQTETSISNGVSSPHIVKKPNKRISLLTSATQTENFWPMPYEHLFLGIFPTLESDEAKSSPTPSPALFNIAQDRSYQPSAYDILDKYVETAVSNSEALYNTKDKDRLQLLYQQLLFERHRRETHAYRNRRLLADAKNTRVLEEYNSALRDRVQLQQKDIDTLKKQLDVLKQEKIQEDKKSGATIQYWENQCKTLENECKLIKEKMSKLEMEICDMKVKCLDLDIQRQQAEASLMNTIAEVNVAREQAWAGEQGRAEFEQVNRDLLMSGELILKYKDLLADMAAKTKSKYELEHIKEAYYHEVKSLKDQLENKVTNLEACRNRISILEQHVHQNEDVIASQKRTLSGINEEYKEKLKAVESKYQTQLQVNRALEARILELWQKIEQNNLRRGVHSPDTSSCHEVNVTTTDKTTGLSPHSSPLSASLASSDGSIMHPDIRDMKNLQALVDQKESAKGRPNEDNGEMSLSSTGVEKSAGDNCQHPSTT